MQQGSSSEVNNAINTTRPTQDSVNGNEDSTGVIHDAPLSHLPKSEVQDDANGIQHVDGKAPRGRKRKIVEPILDKRLRHVSPPWKRVAVEGPTSFIEDGRRKSSRTNAIPLDLQPPAKTRQTRAGHLRKAEMMTAPKILPNSKKVNDPRDTSNKRSSFPVGAQNTHSAKSSPLNNNTLSPRQQHKVTAPVPNPLPRPPSPRPSDSKRQEFPSQSPESSRRGRKRRRSSDHPPSARKRVDQGDEPQPSSPIAYNWKPIKSLRLNFRPPPLPILNPGNIVNPRRYTTLKSLLVNDDALEGEEEDKLDEAGTKREAITLIKLEQAAQPGGILSDGRWTGDAAIAQEEPPGPYTHPDYLLKHVVDFQPRLERERAQHIALAKRLAQLALVEWKRRQPQTEEERLAQKSAQFELVRRRVLKELEQQWDKVREYVKQQKLAQFIEEQDAQTKNELKKMLDKSSQLVMERRRTQTHLDEDGNDDEAMQEAESVDASGSESEGSDDDSDESSSETESTGSDPSSAEGGTDDNNLSRDELLRKYSNLPDIEQLMEGANVYTSATLNHPTSVPEESIVDNEIFSRKAFNDDTHTTTKTDPEDVETKAAIEVFDIDPANCELEVVAPELLDDSDEIDSDEAGDTSDIDSDDDDDDSNSEGQATERGEDSEMETEDGEDEGANSFGALLGFYGPKQQQNWHNSPSHPAEQPVKPDSVAGDVVDQPVGNLDQPTPSFNSTSADISRQMSPATTNTGKPSEADSMTTPEPYEDIETVAKNTILGPGAPKTEVSSLLRGDLRVYQHAGVDWLSGMYANRTNGILADEMGLGKTIQTIALLAHLATAHHVWGPHLVVVPTSVILNWEMEFKKWCPGFKILTYYGTPEERKNKRKGWLKDDQWHVFITSYQLALQDHVPLRRRNWHYMVLDEAHNIKNFRSQRWQTLLNFKSEARLLLTGTPLQNNLTELWSLLFFLEPGQKEQGGFKFTDLATFSRTFHKPVEQILEHGREEMDDEARELVTKLHKVLRPHLLRRLKADVEKQMPKKYEHIVKCRLSKRQRQLYDGYMGLADTRESFQSGNYLSIINCLMQLRKVCNHPDLFETRQIVTSYAMPKSAIAEYEISELLVRKRFMENGAVGSLTNGLCNLWHPNTSTAGVTRSNALAALEQLSELARRQELRINEDSSLLDLQTFKTTMSHLTVESRRSRLTELHDQCRLTAIRCQRRPVYSNGLLERVKIVDRSQPASGLARQTCITQDGLICETLQGQQDVSDTLQDMVITVPKRSEMLDPIIKKFACITPAVVAPGIDRLALTHVGMDAVAQTQEILPEDPFHEARTRLSIAFPDKGLIQYDCGKLQALDRLLRNLQAGGHRALIFTQMTKVLDILEQFLNLHGHLYLRLDGSTKVEQRQVLTDRFNNDTRILTFILSSRSGGLGINLTGADTVIFYDLDWNPAMDKQCQDRCHRIGQTRDVHIYRFVSEGTIEANILRKSNQKRMLDDVVIQEGDFTTDYFNKIDPREFLDDNEEANAALDKVLGNTETRTSRVFEQAEDKEDIEAAKEAQKEIVLTDDADFDEKTGSAGAGTPKTEAPTTPLTRGSAPPSGNVSSPAATAPVTPQDEDMLRDVEVEDGTAEEVEEEPGSHEEFMLRHMTWELRDVIVKPPSDRTKKKSKKGKDHAAIRIRR